jgi:hypothetical protein
MVKEPVETVGVMPAGRMLFSARFARWVAERLASCSSERPVVQSTTGSFFSTAVSRRESTIFEEEKSMITSASSFTSERPV